MKQVSDRLIKNNDEGISGSHVILSCTVMYKLHGGFLNGSGASSGRYPTTEIKKFVLKGNRYPYMSAQAWKKLMRDTFVFLKSEPSYYDRLNGLKKNILNPILYLEDDLFGYSHPFEKQPDQDNPLRFKVVSANRIAPLQATNLIALERNISTEKGFLHLNDSTPLPYSTEFSAGWFLGNIALDLDRIGIFVNSGDVIELPNEILKRHASMISNNGTGRYEVNDRKGRVMEAVKLLFDTIMGLTSPPKASQFTVDFSPKMLFCTIAEGMAPFGPSMFTTDDTLKLSLEKVESLVSSRGHTFKCPLFLGYRKGIPIVNQEKVQQLHAKEIETQSGKVEIQVTSPGQIKNRILTYLEGAY